jgi:uroporphyrinogen-III decarboxylase
VRENMKKLERLAELIHAKNKIDDEIYEVVGNSPIKIINFGDNIDCNLLPPNLFKQYALPYYKKRTKQLKYKAKYTHSHWDGSVKTLLPFAKDTGLDGIEAITPRPQGDVTLEEIRENIPENMILLDLIPAILFLPQYKNQELERCLENIYELFGNRLVLGISDELPPDADIEKVRFVSEWVKEH